MVKKIFMTTVKIVSGIGIATSLIGTVSYPKNIDPRHWFMEEERHDHYLEHNAS
jgi:hypothetical protein